MNKFLTDLINDKNKLFRVICLALSVLSSVVCNIISDSMSITLVYSIFTFTFSVCELVCADTILKKVIHMLMNMDRKLLFCIFIVIALMPTIVGICTKEIVFQGKLDFVKKMAGNPLSNCLGVFIVYSLIKHLSKFNGMETIYLIVSAKKHFFDVVLQFGFIVSFLNAINYNIAEGFSWTNFFNGIHLFVIVFCGVIVIYVFALRLISEQPFEYTVNKIYPTSTLIFTWLFLISCGLSPIVWENAKHEVLLLSLNTFAALCVIWFIFHLIKNKTIKNAKEFPYGAPLVISFLIILNWIVNLFLGGNGDNTKMQFISGAIVLLITVFLIFSVFVDEKDES